MSRNLMVSVRLLLAFTLLTGIVYPLAVTTLAQSLFPEQAAGSLIRTKESRVLGSELIGQPFERPDHFWGRLSATSRIPYDASASSGSNFGPLHPGLRKAVEARIAALKSHPEGSGRIPVDLVTSSASGLDPHISPASAKWQVPRVAAVSGISEDRLRQLIADATTGQFLGILGEPHVNVLRLNLALEREKSSSVSIEP